jgi:hypothetical protein
MGGLPPPKRLRFGVRQMTGAPGRGRRGHFHAALFVPRRASRMKHTGGRGNDFAGLL